MFYSINIFIDVIVYYTKDTWYKQLKNRSMKRILKPIIFLPNLPFIIILSIYIIVRMIIESSFAEFEMTSAEDLLTKDILRWVNVVYPKGLRLLIAFLFYATLLMNILK